MHKLDEQATVVELIYKDYLCWKENVLHELFSTKEINIIKYVPLSFYGRKDQQYWHYVNNDLFIVKSTYHFHKSILARSKGEPSQYTDNKEHGRLFGG